MSTSETPRTWMLRGTPGLRRSVRILVGPDLSAKDLVEVVEKAPVDAERERLLDLLGEIATSGIAFEDDRLRYLDVLIDRGDWEQLLALLREYGRLPNEDHGDECAVRALYEGWMARREYSKQREEELREALRFYAQQRGLGAVLASDGGRIARTALAENGDSDE